MEFGNVYRYYLPILLWTITVEFGNVLRYYFLHPLNYYNGTWECFKILLPPSFFESLQLNLGVFSDTTSPIFLWIITVEFGSVLRYYIPHPLNHYSGNVYRYYLPYPSLNHYSGVWECFKILPPLSFESLQWSLGMFSDTTSPSNKAVFCLSVLLSIKCNHFHT